MQVEKKKNTLSDIIGGFGNVLNDGVKADVVTDVNLPKTTLYRAMGLVAFAGIVVYITAKSLK